MMINRTSRPIVKLYPLEVSSGSGDQSDGNPQGTSNTDIQQDSIRENTDVTPSRPRRKAYSNALQKMTEWTDTLSLAPEDVDN